MQPSLTDRVAQTLLDEVTGGGYRIGEVLPPERRSELPVVDTEARLRSLHFLKRDRTTREGNEPEDLNAGILKASGARAR